MEVGKTKSLRRPNSLLNYIASREFNSYQVPILPKTVFKEIGAIKLLRESDQYMPFALSFCKTSKRSYDLALADHGGYVTLFDTRRNTDVVCEWGANNEDILPNHPAVLDVCWLKEDARIVTASVNKTVKVWDVEEKKCLGVFRGHRDMVDSICSHPTNDDIIVSGSSDGSFRLWDIRCNSNANSNAVVERAHHSPHVSKARVNHKTITSVLWLKDQFYIATSGLKDSAPKFWDTRYLKQELTSLSPLPHSIEKQKLHGITSLSQDERGVFLLASCMDDRIYQYNIPQLERGPLIYYKGSSIKPAIKAAISPDALNIASGSSDGKTYVWPVNKPEEQPTVLSSKESQSALLVDWSFSEFGRLAVSGSTVQIWNKDVDNPEPSLSH